MAAFLSPAWIAEMDAAARAASGANASPGRADSGLRVAVEVPDAPGGAVRYVMVVGAVGARVVAGTDEPADVTLRQPYAVARRIHGGAANAQRILAEGTATIDGDLNRLAAAAPDLARLEDAFAAVRAATTFPE
ncbi:MAG: hypothetical protein JWL73_124 [Actinomycetia bacterium]|nr:hypothetical protein [Actinomycetes bacterium]